MYRDSCEQENPHHFIFLDESGVHVGMSSRYGRAKRHQRVVSYLPFNKGQRVTLIAAIGIEEIKAALYGEWHLDGDLFLNFIQVCLLPVLKPYHVVLMDNLSAHKVAGVRTLIEATGARLVYLPPYSPDLSPIELAWSKIKGIIRKKSARTYEELKEAISIAFKSIKQSDLVGWYEHCGYNVD